MRSLDTKTYELADFTNQPSPQYVVLSHTWLVSDKPNVVREITYQDMQNQHKSIKEGNYKTQGWAKLKNYCDLARSNGWQYAWMDTCCIDKTNSADTQEAINAMFRWYAATGVCYAYLDGVDSRELNHSHETFRTARWFTRGWTLQELLAPTNLIFVDQNWKDIGTREDWIEDVTNACNMSTNDLTDYEYCSIAAKLSWASHRETTIEEDQAYSLLGLFGISMPLCYGEGQLAFRRLQIELIKTYNDSSVFAWVGQDTGISSPIIAPSLAYFRGCGNVEFPFKPFDSSEEYHLDNRGLTIHRKGFSFSVSSPDGEGQIVLRLKQAGSFYFRINRLLLRELAKDEMKDLLDITLLIKQPSPSIERRLITGFWLKFESNQVKVLSVYEYQESWVRGEWIKLPPTVNSRMSQLADGRSYYREVLISRLVNPSDSFEAYRGCRVLEVETLQKKRFGVWLIMNRSWKPLVFTLEWKDLKHLDGVDFKFPQSSNTNAIKTRLRPIPSIDSSLKTAGYVLQMSMK